MKNNRCTRRGLILLVVLGMLSLFSLLAVSYMVVSSQSRSANFGRARQEFRGTNPAKLLDIAIRQVVRGTTDQNSALWHNSLLGDLYGNAVRGTNNSTNYVTADGAKTLRARTIAGGVVLRDHPVRRAVLDSDNWLPAAQMAYSSNLLPEAPRILGGRFLRIPLRWTYDLPKQHNVWNGRVVTFMEGPLQGESFRILRYIGEVETETELPNVPGATPPERAERPGRLLERAAQYSITVDLAKVDQQYLTISGVRWNLASWLSSNTNAYELCYESFATDAYGILLNSGEQNSMGAGIENPTSRQTMAAASVVPALNHLADPLNRLPSGPYQDLAVNLAMNWGQIARANSGFVVQGDMDESYDAPDQNNPALAFIHPSGSSPVLSDHVVPSFHRPSVINYIYQQINDADPLRATAFTAFDLVATIELFQRACGRPLSWRIENLPASIAPPPLNGVLANQPLFDGANGGEYASYVGTSQLVIDWSQWTDAGFPEQIKFENWVRWLTRGPYDVDNDADGIAESVWTDINLPLMTSSEGKLLKALAAFYIEDLGGRIDINKSGSLQQALAGHSDFTADSAISFRPNDQLPQGLGYGTADISLRHLFGADGTGNDLEYVNFMRQRNAAATVANSNLFNHPPGGTGNDSVSLWGERNLSARHNPLRLPGFPLSRVGRSGLSVDVFGNPILYEQTLAADHVNQVVDDPYELGRLDSPYSIADWERLERIGEPDRSHLPGELERRVFSASTPLADRQPIDRRNVGRVVSPRNIALQFPRSAQTYTDRYAQAGSGPRSETRRVSSFLGLVEAISQQRWAPGPMETLPRFQNSHIAQLFPVEFQQNLPLDLNRPFGNGADDNTNGQVDEAAELAGHGIDDNGFKTDDDGDGITDERDELEEPAEMAANLLSHQPAANATANSSVVDETTYTGETAPENVPDRSMFYSNPESQLNTPALGLYDPALQDFANSEIDMETDAVQYAALRQFNGDQSRQLLARHLYCLAQLILPDNYIFANSDGGTMYAYGTDERARFIAQWAVNVVDFRDADHNMTRFSYDPDPFGRDGGMLGWESDVDYVVFGHESPDLLLTETFAFHDLRISPNAVPVRPGSPDRRFDDEDWRQIRVPEGSLFLEFLCPKGPVDNAQGVAATTAAAGNRRYWSTSGELNLSMVTPADYNGVQYPVWRALILEPSVASGARTSVFDNYKTANERRQLNYQLSDDAGQPWSSNSGTFPTPAVDRVIWFTNEELVPSTANLAVPTGSTLDVNDVFKLPPRTTSTTGTDPRSVLVDRGQYLVTAPRLSTYVGQELPLNPSPGTGAPNNVLPRVADSYAAAWLPSDQRVDVVGSSDSIGGQLRMNSFSGSFTAPNCTATILKAHQPVAAWASGYRPGLNVSEPKSDDYYQRPTGYIDADPMGGFPFDGYVNRSTDAFASSSVEQQDLAADPSAPSMTPISQFWEIEPDAGGNPLRPKFMSRMNWSSAVLQRLAHPDRPWHEELNPYITQDWMPIDLTVFSGEVSDFEPNPTVPSQEFFKSIDGPDFAEFDDPNTPEDESMPVDDPATTAVNEALGEFRFNSRQKTGVEVGTNVDVDLSDTTVGTSTLTFGSVPQLAGRTFYSYHTENPFSSGSKANQDTCFEFPWAIQPNSNASRLSGSLATSTWTTLGDLNTRFGLRGADLSTTAVPAYPRAPVYARVVGGGREAYAPAAPVVLNRDFVNSYELLSVLASAPGKMMQEFTAETPMAPSRDTHLFDFEMNRGSNAALAPREKSAAAMFELVDVRNPWLESFELLNPELVNIPRGQTPTTDYLMRQVVLSPYRAPFNRIPNYVQPGRINLNTISKSGVYRALMWNAMTPRNTRNGAGTTLYEAELNSARSRVAAGSTMLNSNPVLNGDSPTQFAGALRSSWSAAAAPADSVVLGNAVDATILRTNPSDATFRALSAGASVPHNAMLQNMPASRLKNLTSNNSHTYSIRVTIGYFEFDPVTGLGREYGIDEGTVKRHRGFYVVDRSIPVGFREGLDLNTDKCILIRRIVE